MPNIDCLQQYLTKPWVLVEVPLYTALSKRDEITSKLDADTSSHLRSKSNLDENVAYTSSNIELNVRLSERSNSFKYQRDVRW
ncbi:hypothetical protein PC129_g11090 [Phytophthora cactorum]|uniref:Uncharacterized protein n=1 Tax=Phytophthora cactorum TaxID=29920 RepID=A0A329S874_9STRA|nr:hypothetical protein Pcac1_g18596 [Phytophthora cactorum]KAG2820020.1 hypothetical protein PC112_g11934 [Phytophthora cactorum]KAG2825661.1 hypothetical protein PC111_g9278 [Phytophthora cactorum]KAG2856261.1 hypothetical protein PC113_g11727 [Phytophthora cactorum]KAG2892382.1 hypothetical protein PC117_g24022 [Phytophthora cactorum]